MSIVLKSQADADLNVVQPVNGESFSLDNVSGYSFQVVADVATPPVQIFVDGDVNVATDEVTETAHGFFTGLQIDLTTDGTLPAGLLAQAYFLIVIDVDTYQFALTLSDANAGTQVDITAAAGGGNHSTTPTALAAGLITHQLSNNDVDFFDIAAGTAVTVDANFHFQAVSPPYKFARLRYTLTAGLINFTNNVILRRDV